MLGLTNGRQPAASGRKKKATHTRGRSVVLSTIDATYELTDSILQEWNDKSNIVGIFCDSFKAFDSVEHKNPPPPFLVSIDTDHNIVVLLRDKNLCKYLTFQKCREKYRYPYTETALQNIYI